MRIGIIAPYNILSLSSGAPRRVFNMAYEYCIQGADVFVLHCGPEKIISDKLKFINFKTLINYPDSNNCLHPLNIFYPLKLSQFLKNYKLDIIQLEQPWISFPTVFFTKQMNIPCILDCHNVEFDWSLTSSRFPILTVYTFLIEKFAILNSSLILAVSKVDKNRLSKFYKVPEEKIFVAPNGVDLSRFSYMSSKLVLKKKLGFKSDDKIILFHGLMSGRPNYEAAKIIVDFIAPKLNEAQFIIIGKNPPSWLRTKAKLQENVFITGFVSKIEEYINIADLCIVPILRGSGSRLKILEYMAAGKPIVATYKAIEGIDMVNKTHGIFYKEVDKNFINGIKQILHDKRLAEELGRNAKELSQIYDWSVIGKKLYETYTNLVG